MSESPSAPSYSFWQVLRVAINLALRAIEEVRALSRQPGPEGPRGKDGEPGKLEAVRAWREGLHEEREVVTRDGRTFQALRDTSQEPPHDDWICIAERGRDGQGLRVRGTYEPGADYRAGDIVMRNSSSFVALVDNPPGDCPGEGWQLWAGAGKRGKDGLPGLRGERGLPGEPAPIFIGWRDDLKSYMATPVFSDGREGAPLNIRLYLEQLLIERGL
jgi:hypothetical protein